MKRAQITPFVIIGLILLAGVGVVLFTKNNVVVDKKVNVPEDISPVYDYVDKCVEKTFSEGIDYIGQKGGYYDNPERVNDMEIAYYLYKNQNYMPSREKLEEELANYVSNELQFCLNEFYELDSFEISAGDISSTVKVENDKALLKMNYPLTITKNDKTYNLDEFESNQKTRLGLVYDIAKQIIDEQVKDTEIICVGCLYDLSVKNDVFIKTIDYNGDTIFTITDENSKINDKALVFNFVNKYN